VGLAVFDPYRKIIGLFMRRSEDVFAQSDLVFVHWRYFGKVFRVERFDIRRSSYC
jgi:hypothetical protein